MTGPGARRWHPLLEALGAAAHRVLRASHDRSEDAHSITRTSPRSTDMHDDIPDRLAALPVCPRRGLPIPYANVITAGGSADFATLDSRCVHDVALQRVCGVCGQELDYWIVFAGGPRCATDRAYVDPPMHHECARAALRLCPYLFRQDMKRRKSTAPGAGTPMGFTEAKPEAYLLYVTRSYKITITEGGIIFTPAPAVRIERYDYVDGRLTLLSGPATALPTSADDAGS